MNKRKQHEQEVLENDLQSWLEEKFGDLKPYASQILLAVCALVAVLIAAAYLWQQTESAEAAKWQDLSYARLAYRRSNDATPLVDVADQYPDDPAGNWALLMAADAEARSGLAELSSDRNAGFDKIEKAIGFYRRVVDSSGTKSPMMQRRSTYGLAYALESNGEFEEATKYYQQLADLGDETPFLEEATRGLQRTKNPKYAELFTKFREYDDVPEVAPGMTLPQRPDISFPGLGAAQPDAGGGSFGEATEETQTAVGSETDDLR